MGQYAKRLHRKLASKAHNLPTKERKRRPGELLPGGVKDIPTLIKEGFDPIHAVYVFMQNEPNYWNEFVFKAYHHHQQDAIFLTGIPDLNSSLPHA